MAGQWLACIEFRERTYHIADTFVHLAKLAA